MVDIILADGHYLQRLQQLDFIEFEISERFPQLFLGKENKRLTTLSRHFRLWLDDLGMGKANMTAMYDGLFTYAKLDKHFFWRMTRQASGKQLFSALLKNINPLCKGIVISGIEQGAYLDWLYDADILGVPLEAYTEPT